MKKFLMVAALVACIAMPAELLARKTTYVVTNRRFNYVKLVEVKPRVAEDRNMTQPIDISEKQMRDILKSLKLSKHHLLGDKVTEREIFNDRAINYLAPALCQAFRDASNKEEVQFAYNVKDPKFILRNDRLTSVTAWVSGRDLYLEFNRLAQKLLGDTAKRGRESYTLGKAQGIRMTLEVGPGQTMAAVGSKTMVVDLNHNFKPAIATSKTEEGVTTASNGVTSTETTAAPAAPAPVMSDDETTRRLEKLDMLRKRNLISNKEYKQKKAEILKDI